MPPTLATVLLLLASNAFMTYAWYGHLNDGRKATALWLVIGTSWLIALPEYCLAVPANRLGAQQAGFSQNQLKILQEGISIAVFLAISLWAWKQVPRWQDLVAYTLILSGLALALLTRR